MGEGGEAGEKGNSFFIPPVSPPLIVAFDVTVLPTVAFNHCDVSAVRLALIMSEFLARVAGLFKYARSPANITKRTHSFCLQHPYPSEDQKKQLAQDTGLTILQVNNW